MDFLELSKRRYSVLHYQNRNVPDDLLHKILKAGISAPTACNNQPEKIKLINSEDDRTKLNHVVPSKYYVPAAFLVCYDKTTCWTRKFDKKSSGEIDASIVTTHMMLAAFEMGVGSTWVMHFDPFAMRETFRIPENVEPVALLVMGYPAPDAEPLHLHSEFRPMEETVLYETF